MVVLTKTFMKSQKKTQNRLVLNYISNYSHISPFITWQQLFSDIREFSILQTGFTLSFLPFPT